MLGQVQTPEIIRAHIKARLEDGHLSVFEHASFTFGIEGITRTCSHQLVRHRIASYSQQSQRHTEPSRYVLPESIRQRNICARILIKASEAYNLLVASGVSREDARFILPQACTTNLVLTMNARSLMNFFDLRLSEHAQWEIRDLAKLMLGEVIKVAPTIFEGYKECLTDVRIGK
jgi:thymidylate synthase (FAD)